MADFVFNIAKGAAAEKIRDGANIQVLVVDVAAVTDATIKDFATVSAITGGGVTERTANGWARKSIANASVTLTVDNTNDRVDLDIADQTWTAVTSGTSTDLITVEDTGADASRVPLVQQDFAITPDGSDVTAVITNFYRAS
jgi:hypothetical protein